MQKIILIIFILLVSACRQDTNNDVLPPKAYQEVLKEILLIDLVTQDLKLHDSLKQNLMLNLYKKYQVDSLKLKKTTAYYIKHPDILVQIYDNIYRDFKHISDSLEQKQPGKKPASKSQTDVIKLPAKDLKKFSKKPTK